MREPYYSGERWRLYVGDCLETMRGMEAGSVDAVVTDPPYGLEFMGKDWDGSVPGAAFWSEALRVAKPGAYLLAFGGTRTFHRLTVAIEDAGWEIRDCLSWLYGSGFPKSHNLRGEREGWGTALKPSWEPIIMARKPLRGTVAANVEAFGTGALNIDGCRIGTEEITTLNTPGVDKFAHKFSGSLVPKVGNTTHTGRWPANVLLDPEAAAAVDSQAGEEVCRFFYVAKPDKSERDEGLDGLALRQAGVKNDSGRGYSETDPHREILRRNHHPTVKPVDLMRYLCRLVTPPAGLVLDPFMGSGTTGRAAIQEGFAFVGCELSPEYAEIAARRIGSAPLPLDFDAPEQPAPTPKDAPALGSLFEEAA